MKRIGGLFEQICDRGNLAAALWAAAKGKRSRPDVLAFVKAADEQLNGIVSELRSGRFEFEEYRTFDVHDTKSRTIRAPTFRDRVVHHALIRILGPMLEKSADKHSYACRKGRGQHAALRQARRWTRRTLWYGKMDFRKYYDSVDHALLRHRLAQRFSEPKVLSLLDCVMESWHSQPATGLPIGALTSQYLGNFFLDGFDARMKENELCARYIRYMDDIVIWNRKESMPEIRAAALDAAAKMSLQIKHGGEWNACRYGVPFLGFVIYPDRLRLGREGRRRLRRRLSELRRAFQAGDLNDLQYQRQITSLMSHDLVADDEQWRRSVLKCQPCPAE